MENFPELEKILTDSGETLRFLTEWLKDNAFVLANVAQLAAVLLAFLIAKFTASRLITWLEKVNATHRYAKQVEPVLRSLKPLGLPMIWLILQWFAVFIALNAGWPHHVMRGVVSLLTAWLIIRLMTGFVANQNLSRGIAAFAWTVAALNIVGLLGATVEFLDAIAINLGAFHLSVLGIIKGAIALALFLWLAGAASRLAEKQLKTVTSLTPSVQVLFGKLLKITLYTAAILIGMDSVGIDLTALAVFTGAIGLGIGFGLQKVFSNLISGVILLLDRSVKPGDVIAIGDTFGWINQLGARYVSLITRDGTEHLIPNEELISQRVENWSFSHQKVRLKLPVGISYNSDVRQAMELAVEVAAGIGRVLADPAPVCRLIAFGDSSVNLELRVWISDPQGGVANVQSDILVGVWDAFKENGIEFPYPQQDLHLRSSVPLEVRTSGQGTATAFETDTNKQPAE